MGLNLIRYLLSKFLVNPDPVAVCLMVRRDQKVIEVHANDNNSCVAIDRLTVLRLTI